MSSKVGSRRSLTSRSPDRILFNPGIVALIEVQHVWLIKLALEGACYDDEAMIQVRSTLKKVIAFGQG
jgi:hypothetical protein